MNETNVKKRIRQLLVENGINPTQLAKIAGVNQKTLNNQINSDTSLSVSTILLILHVLPNVSAEWLLKGEEGIMAKTEDRGSSNKYFEMCKMLLENRRRDADLYLRLADMMKNE